MASQVDCRYHNDLAEVSVGTSVPAVPVTCLHKLTQILTVSLSLIGWICLLQVSALCDFPVRDLYSDLNKDFIVVSNSDLIRRNKANFVRFLLCFLTCKVLTRDLCGF